MKTLFPGIRIEVEVIFEDLHDGEYGIFPVQAVDVSPLRLEKLYEDVIISIGFSLVFHVLRPTLQLDKEFVQITGRQPVDTRETEGIRTIRLSSQRATGHPRRDEQH